MSSSYGFIQLGRRSRTQRARIREPRYLLTLLVINREGDCFSAQNLYRLRDVCRSMKNDAEILLLANQNASAGYESLLQEFPELRMLIPVRELSFRQCLYLGIQEANAPRVMVLDPGCYIDNLDLDRVFRAFQNKHLFALGFRLLDSAAHPLPSQIKAFPEQGYLRLLAIDREYPARSFFLRDFLGIYDREKMLMLGEADRSLNGLWASADFFLGAWTRGWITVVDPESTLVCEYKLHSLEAQGSLRERVRYYHNERGFLRRNFLDRESRRFRRRYMIKTARQRLLHFDFAPAIAGLISFLRKFFPWKRVPLRREAAIGPLEVFEKLVEKEEEQLL